jgi:hypothetical protein
VAGHRHYLGTAEKAVSNLLILMALYDVQLAILNPFAEMEENG